jgi:hypothetical protein
MSSIDHDGLGRYGDPLNPHGDLRTMQWLKCVSADVTLALRLCLWWRVRLLGAVVCLHSRPVGRPQHSPSPERDP